MTPLSPARLLQKLLCGVTLLGAAAGTFASPVPPLSPLPGATLTGNDGGRAIVSDATGRFVYRLTYNTAAIGQFGIDAQTGKLTALGPEMSVVPGRSTIKGSALVIDPQGRFVYAAVTGGIAGFGIGKDGLLTPVSDKLAGGGNAAATALALSPDSKFLYELLCWSASPGMPATCGVAIFSADPQSGALTQVTTNLKPMNGVAVMPVLNGGGGIAVTPDGNSLLLSAGPANKGTLAVYARNAGTGTIGALVTQKPTATTSPQGILVTPKGRVYVAEREVVPPGSSFRGATAISAFQFNGSTQTLTPVAGSPWVPTTPVSAITVNTTGSRLYATGCEATDSGCNGSVWAYAIDATTGALTPMGQAQASAADPAGITVDPTSRYVWSANGNSGYSGSVTAFSTDAPTLANTTVTVGLLNISANATFSNPGELPEQATGFYYSTSAWPAEGGSTVSGEAGYGALTATLSRASLQKDVPYYVQPYFTTSAGFTYLGNVVSFVNGSVIQRMAQPEVAFNVLGMSASIRNLYGQTVAKTGFRIGTGNDPATSKNIDLPATLNGMTFTAQEPIASLTSQNVLYNIWPYIKTTNLETVYGEPYPYFNIAPPLMNIGHNFTDLNHLRLVSSLVLSNATAEACGFVYGTHSKPTHEDKVITLPACGEKEFSTEQPLPIYRDPASKFKLNETYFIRSFVTMRGVPYYSGNEVIFYNVNPVQLLITSVAAESASFTFTLDIQRVNGSLVHPPYEISWKKVGAAQPAKQPIGNEAQQSGTIPVSPGASYTAQVTFGYDGDKGGLLQTDVVGFTAPAK